MGGWTETGRARMGIGAVSTIVSATMEHVGRPSEVRLPLHCVSATLRDLKVVLDRPSHKMDLLGIVLTIASAFIEDPDVRPASVRCQEPSQRGIC